MTLNLTLAVILMIHFLGQKANRCLFRAKMSEHSNDCNLIHNRVIGNLLSADLLLPF